MEVSTEKIKKDQTHRRKKECQYMSKIVARMEKMKTGNLQGIQRHNQRETENHSNKDIDISRSIFNYDLIHSHSVNYQNRVKEIIDSQRLSTRAVRKDAVLVDEWIITSDPAFFEFKTDSKEFFQDTVAYFSDRCGSQNIAYATVHLDETTPHMHLGIVPMIDGKLSSKQMFDRSALKAIQDDLPKFLQEKGHQIERGLKGSERKHLSVEEFKENKREVDRMSQQVEQLRTDATSLSSDRTQLDQASHDLWHDDWLETIKELPDFKMSCTIKNRQLEHEPLIEVQLDEQTPKEYKMTFSDVFTLLKEKFNRLKDYLAEKLHQLTFKEQTITDDLNVLGRRKNALDDKLEALNHEIEVKERENTNLNTAIQGKMDYISKIETSSELAMAMPSYVRPSKLNKEMLLVPKDKWLDKHVSANVINSFSKLKDSLTHIDKRIEKNTEYDTGMYSLEREVIQLNRQVNSLRNENILYWNSLASMINNGIISKDFAKQIKLPHDFKKEFDLEPPLSKQQQILKDRNRQGPSLGR